MMEIFRLVMLCIFFAGGMVSNTHAQVRVDRQFSDDEIHATIKNYLDEKTRFNGYYEYMDPDTFKISKFGIVKIHPQVSTTEHGYIVCVDFKDLDTGEMLDLDFNIDNKEGELFIGSLFVHQKNGRPLFNYNEKNERVAVKNPKRHKSFWQ